MDWPRKSSFLLVVLALHITSQVVRCRSRLRWLAKAQGGGIHEADGCFWREASNGTVLAEAACHPCHREKTRFATTSPETR